MKKDRKKCRKIEINEERQKERNVVRYKEMQKDRKKCRKIERNVDHIINFILDHPLFKFQLKLTIKDRKKRRKIERNVEIQKEMQKDRKKL